MMRIKWIASALIAVLAIGVAGTHAGENELSKTEKQAGWKLLFDGKSADHWRNYKKDTIGEQWVIQDGALTLSKRGGGDIITKTQYENFELSLEYNISKGGNSGIMFHVTENEKTPWQSGPEIQVQDNVDGHDPQKAGWLYQLYSANEDATKPAGQWNNLVLRIAPDTCAIYMNGVRYARFQKGNADWDKRVAKSKFSKYPNFGKATKGHICLQDHGNLVSYRNIKIREIKPGASADPVDGALPYKAALAFTNVKWSGWEPTDDRGRPQALRPIALTNAGDGSNRVIMATQRGVLHAFDNHDKPQESKVILDHSAKVTYRDNKNEEGLLGLAFHPKFKDNGQFFLYYTSTEEPQLSVISRFTVGKDGVATSKSEEEIMRLKQPYWNHNGGTIAFGKDGYLYVALGDGGAGNDPHGNGQNLSTLLGSILRVDVDSSSPMRNYGIPKDNPFVGKKGARPEIYAYGFRNVWRLAFDRETGDLWAADVGQNLWEEINIVVKGGNYGWNLREGQHMFGKNGSSAREGLIEPVWEYDHNVGKSITGGYVYRGSKLPGLIGSYIYADYVTGKIWALKVDPKSGKAVSNHSIPTDKMPVISFGEDEQGEVYFMMVSANGRGIYRLEKTGK